MKKIIVRCNTKTGEIKIETKGFTGESCREADTFLRRALGNEIAEELKPAFYLGNENEEEDSICFEPFCG